MRKRCLFGLVLIAFLLVAVSGGAAPRNFIIIMTDDQGYQDLGCFGSQTIATPNIDRLAEGGMRMTSFYVASSVCSPSRAALMTGRMPKRVGVPGVLFPNSTTGLPPEEITIAEMLKAKGYKTAIVGKWHLGHQAPFMPMNQGFDSYFGIPYSNDMSISREFDIAPDVKLNEGYTREMMEQDRERYIAEYSKLRNKVPLLRGNTIIEYPVDQRTLTRRYAEEAVKFIKANKDTPFFLYLPHTMPHKPLFIEDAFADQSKGGLYGDIIQQIDWSVGEVVNALKENGLDKNTLILYCSDNGPAGGAGGSAAPLRGVKFMTFEGGQRVPAVLWAPGTVKAGTVCNEIAGTLDLFPTIAHYAGAELPEGRTYDGYNMAELIEGKTAKSPRNEFYFYEANSETVDGIRVGDWKYLIKGDRNAGGSKNKKGKVQPKQPEPKLYNLKDDIGESNNLIEKYPEKAEELVRKMNAFDATVKQP